MHTMSKSNPKDEHIYQHFLCFLFFSIYIVIYSKTVYESKLIDIRKSLFLVGFPNYTKLWPAPKKISWVSARKNSIFVNYHHANFFTLFWINFVFYRVCHIDKSSQYNNQEYNIFAKQKPIRCLSDNGLIMLSLIFMFLLTHIII